jgi:ribosomal protein S18 acetylase RimI-like enzyme
MASFGPYHLTQTNVAVDADRAFLTAQLRQFNNQRSPQHLHIRTHLPQPLDFFLRDDTGLIVGGLTAATYWSWLAIDHLWLREDLRSAGYGRQLLALAERSAQARGCAYAYLTTFSFQARGFYEKAGYHVVGQLTDYPPGETYFWLRKDFQEQ